MTAYFLPDIFLAIMNYRYIYIVLTVAVMDFEIVVFRGLAS